jgi:hypothetical protein
VRRVHVLVKGALSYPQPGLAAAIAANPLQWPRTTAADNQFRAVGGTRRGRMEKAPRRRVLKYGNILFGKDPIPCTVQNISERGACLKVPTTNGIPVAFDFLLAGEPARTCKTIWRDDTQIGVMFIQRECQR